MPSPVTCLHYRLTLKATAASTGFFAAVPHPPKSLKDGLDYQRRHPHDSFMQAYLIERIGEMDRAEAEAMLIQSPPDDMLVRTLVMEAATLYPHPPSCRATFRR